MKNYNEYFSKNRGLLDWFTPQYWKMKKGINVFLAIPFERLTLNREILQWLKFYDLKEEVKIILKNWIPKKLRRSTL